MAVARWRPGKIKGPALSGQPLFDLVEPNGMEPLTSTMPLCGLAVYSRLSELT